MKTLRPIEISLPILPGPTDQALRLFDEWCKKRNTKMILFCTIHQNKKTNADYPLRQSALVGFDSLLRSKNTKIY